MPSWPALRGRVAALKETLLHSGEQMECHVRFRVPNRKFWTKLYDPTSDEITLDEVKRIAI